MSTLKNITASDLDKLIKAHHDPVRKSVKIENICCVDRFDFLWPDKLDIHFNNCEFTQSAAFYSLAAESQVVLNHCTFFNALEFDGPHENLTLKITFSQLKAGMSMQESTGIKLFMGRTEGKGQINLSGVQFELCSFKDFKSISDTREDKISFDNCVFTHTNFKESVLQNATFNNARFINHANFDRAKLNYTSMPGGGNFFNVVFEADAYFSGVDFSKGAMFNGAKFKGLALFVGSNPDHYDCVADFSGCNFEKRGFFDDARFKTLLLNHVTFKEITSFNSVKCQSLTLNKTIFIQSADFLDADIQKGSRETYRAIKNEFMKNNNSVEGQLYQAKEMRVYEKGITLRTHTKEKIVLWFNKVSNDFGTNWLRAVRFTLICSLAAYTIYMITLSHTPVMFGWNGWNDFGQAINLSGSYFVKFFIVTHDLEFMAFAGPNFGSYLTDFIGRIFIGYGIFQTIQAFRKYGK